MGIFNPQIAPESEPRFYLNLSKPISTPDFKSESAIALKDTGNIIEGAIKGANQVVDVYAENTARDAAEGEQRSQIQTLQAAKDNITSVKTQANPNVAFDPNVVSTTPMDQQKDTLFPQTGTAGLPSEIAKDLPAQLQTLSNARANGKLSPTDYYARMDALASDVRSRFPAAYRDVIDREFSKVTGGIPANKMVESLMQDLNASATNKQKDIEDTIRLLQENPSPGWNNQVDGLRSGRITPSQAREWVAPAMSEKYRLEAIDRRIKTATAQGTFTKEDAVKNMNEFATATAQKYIHGVTTIPGWEGKNIDDIIQQASLNKLDIKPEQATALAGIPFAWKQQYEREVEAEFSKDRGGGKSLQGMGTIEEANKIKAAGAAVFDGMQKALTDKDYGLAFKYVRLMPAMRADADYKLWKNDDMAAFVQLSSAIKAEVGEQAFQQIFIRNLLPGFLDKTKAFMDKSDFLKMNLMTQNPVTSGPKSFTDALKVVAADARANNIDPTEPDPTISKSFENLFSIVDSPNGGLVDERLPLATRRTMADNVFDQSKNKGLMQYIQHDIRDPNNPSKTIAGKESWFYRMTRPEVTSVIHRINSDTEKRYNDSIQTFWEQDIAKPALQDLGGIKLEGQNFKVLYHQQEGDRPPRFAMEVNGKEYNPTINTTQAQYENFVTKNLLYTYDTLSKINKGMAGFSAMAKGRGESSIDYSVAETLMNALPKGTDMRNFKSISNLPANMVSAITAANQEEYRKNQEKKDLQNRQLPQ